jgi:imidazolonepropionase-like amidohydrolase
LRAWLGEHCSGGEAEFAVEGCAAVCETAAQLGMPVAVHTGAAEGCKQAIRCGVRSLEHGYLINDEALDMAENAGVLLVPTMQAIREDRAGLAKGTLADYTAAKFPRDAEQISIPTA